MKSFCCNLGFYFMFLCKDMIIVKILEFKNRLEREDL